MLTTIDAMRTVLPKSPMILGGINAICLSLPIGIAFNFRQMSGSNVLMLFGVTLLIGLSVGWLIKYRVEFSIKFTLLFIFYFMLLFPFLMGGAGAIIFAEISGERINKFLILFLYLSSIVLPLAFGVSSYIGKLKAPSKSDREWMSKLKRCVDFDKYVIEPRKFQIPQKTNGLSAAIWSTGAMVTNVPILFQLYTGSRYNAIFLAMPLIIGGFAFLSVKMLGPQIACLWLLRKYEKQTGRCFVNADYEKIQELRRTFFLSRWLMKDYRLASDRSTAA